MPLAARSAPFPRQSGEVRARKMLESLIEQAGSLYDSLGPRWRRPAKLRQGAIRQGSMIEVYPRVSEPVLDNGKLGRRVKSYKTLVY